MKNYDPADVLRFYADRRNHRGVGVSAVYRDGGERAREAVGKCPNCNGLGEAKTGMRLMDQDGLDDEYEKCRTCWGSGLERSETGS